MKIVIENPDYPNFKVILDGITEVYRKKNIVYFKREDVVFYISSSENDVSNILETVTATPAGSTIYVSTYSWNVLYHKDGDFSNIQQISLTDLQR